VTIGDVTFDWEPSTPSGAVVALGNRGSDPRLARSTRTTAAQRKSAKLARRGRWPASDGGVPAGDNWDDAVRETSAELPGERDTERNTERDRAGERPW
jgi:GTP-binding protein